MKFTINKFLFIFMFIPFFIISIIYASFSAELMIDGVAHLRIPAEIRITNLKAIEQTNGAYETYSSEYNKDSTSIYATLPNLESTLTYEVTIKNTSDTSYDLSKIIIDNNSNPTIKYEIDIELGEEIPGNSEKTFTIKLTYNVDTIPSDITDSLQIRYEFLEHINPYVVATYDYTGNYKTFTAPLDGYYKLEVWGAQGGSYSTKYYGGYGGYSSGVLKIKADKKLYVYVGQQGIKAPCTESSKTLGGYNGGGNSTYKNSTSSKFVNVSGGGATDIRTVKGTWNNANSLLSRILVAGGGSGSTYYDSTRIGFGGAGGGTTGGTGTSTYNTKYKGTGGTQTSGGIGYKEAQNGSFGQGGHGDTTGDWNGTGGGGGWYGGAAGYSYQSAGGGGSGFALSEETITSAPDGYLPTSEYYMTDTITIIGTSEVPTYDGVGTMIGNTGNGYAKITFIERWYE